MQIKPPEFAEKNLSVCDGGVYANYLLSGMPYMFKRKERRRRFAELHRQLTQALPSGTLLYLVAAPTDIDFIMRRALWGHLSPAELRRAVAGELQDPWVQHVQAYESTFRAYAPYQRLFWIAMPVDAGLEGYAKGSAKQRFRNWLAGADSEAATTLEGWRETADTMVRGLPRDFKPTPVTEAQQEWFWDQFCSLGAFNDPFPAPTVPARGVFRRAKFHPRGGRRDESILKVTRPDNPEVRPSYQSVLTLFSAQKLRFPGSEIFKLIDHIDPALGRVNCAMRLSLNHVQDEKNQNTSTAKNIRDQVRQRGIAALNDDELKHQMQDLREYNNLLSAEPGQKGMNVDVVFAAGADSLSKARNLEQALFNIMDRSKVALKSFPGSQAGLIKIFAVGNEKQAGLDGMGHPTTPTKFSRFVPLISTGLGNSTGIPLLVNYSTLRREIVLLDLQGASGRGHVGVILIGGSPGGGKSHCSKMIVIGLMKRRSRIHVVDPTDTREWEKAIGQEPGVKVIDVAGGKVSMDLLRLLSPDVGGEVFVDHLMPLLGYPAESSEGDRLELLLEPASRDTNGIGSWNRLVEVLRREASTDADREMLNKFEVLSNRSYMRALTDELLEAPDISKLSGLVWNMAGIPLPTSTENDTEHLASRISRRERAGQAIYGICAELSQQLFFNDSQSSDFIVLEEAEGYLNSPAGGKRAHKITREARRLKTGLVVISQNLINDCRKMGTEFVTQTILTRFDEDDVAKAHLERFMGITEAEYPDVVRRYIDDTSPPELNDTLEMSMATDDFDLAMSDFGKTISGREGECFFRDEFRRVGRGKLLGAPTAELADRLNTNPDEQKSRDGDGKPSNGQRGAA